MISRLRGTLLTQAGEVVEIATPGGVVYEVDVPLTVAQRLPPVGTEIELLTLHIVREDHAALYGFIETGERELFRRLLGASGVGGKLALAMLSTFSAPRLARALKDRDVAALVQVPGVGKKTAEKISVELGDRVGDLDLGASAPDAAGDEASDAVRALISLGVSFQEADRGVREVLATDGVIPVSELIRKVLANR